MQVRTAAGAKLAWWSGMVFSSAAEHCESSAIRRREILADKNTTMLGSLCNGGCLSIRGAVIVVIVVTAIVTAMLG